MLIAVPALGTREPRVRLLGRRVRRGARRRRLPRRHARRPRRPLPQGRRHPRRAPRPAGRLTIRSLAASRDTRLAGVRSLASDSLRSSPHRVRRRTCKLPRWAADWCGSDIRSFATRCSSPRSKAGTTPATRPPAPPTGSCEKSHAQRFASIDPDEHVDYQSRRPRVELVDGVARSITWPAHDCFAAPFGDRDLVVLRGVEPNIRWKAYCNSVMSRRRRDRLRRWSSPSARCSATCRTPAACASPAPRPTPSSSATLGLVPSRYEGPTGIVGVLHDACRDAGIRSASLWAPVPHYIATPPNPPATRALLERFAHARRLAARPRRARAARRHLAGRRSTTRSRDNDEVQTTSASSRRGSTPKTPTSEGVVLGDDGDVPERRRARRRGRAVPPRAGRRVLSRLARRCSPPRATAGRGCVRHDRGARRHRRALRDLLDRASSSTTCRKRSTSSTTGSPCPRSPPTSSASLELVGGAAARRRAVHPPRGAAPRANMVGAIATAGRSTAAASTSGSRPALLVAMLFLVWAGPARSRSTPNWAATARAALRLRVSRSTDEQVARDGFPQLRRQRERLLVDAFVVAVEHRWRSPRTARRCENSPKP